VEAAGDAEEGAGAVARTSLRAVALVRRTGARPGFSGRGWLAVSLIRMMGYCNTCN